MSITVRPISTYPVRETVSRRRAPFRVTPGRTMDELERELDHLRARDVVLELDVRETEISTRTGWPKADARPRTPRVVLSFTHPEQGGVRYPCDTFTTWEGNLRAIALALEALRAVSRYGVVRKGEQYAGWRALPASTGPAQMTAWEAAELLAEEAHLGPAVIHGPQLIGDAGVARMAIRTAQRRTHPDTGGTSERFQRVQEAARLVREHFARSGVAL